MDIPNTEDWNFTDVRFLPIDTTSFSVFGDYDHQDSPLNITYGYSKDKRPDLKQFMVSMLCVDHNIPIIVLIRALFEMKKGKKFQNSHQGLFTLSFNFVENIPGSDQASGKKCWMPK